MSLRLHILLSSTIVLLCAHSSAQDVEHSGIHEWCATEHDKGLDEMRQGEYHEATRRGRKIIDSASTVGYDDGVISGYDLLARASTGQQRYSEAISYCLYVQNHLCNDPGGNCWMMLHRLMDLMEKAGQHERSIALKKEKLAILSESGRQHHQVNMCTSISASYLHLEQPDSAIFYCRKAMALPVDSTNLFQRIHLHNNIGVAFRQTGELDSARFHFGRIMTIIDSHPGGAEQYSIMNSVAKFNLAKTDVLEERLEEGVDLLRTAIDELSAQEQHDLVVEGKVFLASIYLNNGDAPKALKELGDALQVVRKHGMVEKEVEVLGKILEAKSTARLPLERSLLDRYLHLQDSLSRDNALKRKLIEGEYTDGLIQSEKAMRELADQKVRSQKEAFNQERRIDQLQDRVLLLLGILAVSIPVIVLLRVRSIQRRKLKEKEEEEARMKNELEYKNDHLSKMALDISRKREFAQELIEKISVLKEDEREVRSIVNFIRAELNLEKSSFEFDHYMSQINFGFLEALRSKHPDLSKADEKLCIMIKLGLSNKEIANIQQIQPLSVKTAKNRLRKKLGLEAGELTFEYLEEDIFS